MFKTAVSTLINFILPPRASEKVIETLTLEDLYNLSNEEGLPYQHNDVRALVWEIKYYANKAAAKLAGAYLADELLALAAEEIGMPLLIPVPMHPSRRKTRGHNQTEILCQAACLHLREAYEYRPDVLTRATETPLQQGLQRSKRLKNVAGSMVATEAVRDRVCMVIDDVTTTGATLAEAKRALLKAGARRVHCVALAKS